MKSTCLEAWEVSTYKENSNKEALVCMQAKYIVFYSIQGIYNNSGYLPTSIRFADIVEVKITL